ncbi:FAD-binding oxidoreductase [Candidatus Saccharibacteria bacterium]|nr:FAD-binding oxidoreductase [Candidatus Saccharibacteria bacterium]
MLSNLIKGEIHSSAAAREAYSTDASIFQVYPLAIAVPQDVDDLSKIIHYATTANKHGGNITIAPRNGGTCMSGGPLTEGIVIDTSRYLNRIGEIDTFHKTIVVQSGVMHRDVEKLASAQGLIFAPYTSSKDLCGIGGMIGNNASGELSLVYGPTSNNVASLKVLLSDGKEYDFNPLTRKQLKQKLELMNYEGDIYRQMIALLKDNRQLIKSHHPRVTKNAAGYALWELWDQHEQVFNLGRLFIGAQATLGIVTESTLKLVDKAPHEQMIVCTIDSINQLTDIVRTIVHHGASICETFDHHTYELARQQYPSDAENAHFANGKHMVVYGIFEGDTKEQAEILAGQAKNVIEQSLQASVYWVESPEIKSSYQAIRRYSYKMLKDMNSDTKKAMPFIEDTIVPLEHYGEFVSALEAILEDYDMTYTYAGHIGEGSIRLIPLVNRLPKTADAIMELEGRVNDLVLAFRGSISVDHNDGIIRTPFLEQQYGSDMISLFHEVKNIFDPYDIFNHGKKVNGTIEFARSHINL